MLMESPYSLLTNATKTVECTEPLEQIARTHFRNLPDDSEDYQLKHLIHFGRLTEFRVTGVLAELTVPRPRARRRGGPHESL